MRKIREILRLKWECHCSYHLIACSVGVSSSTVRECLRRAAEANLSWPLEGELDDTQLEILLYPPVKKRKDEDRMEIDWSHIHKELKRKAMTLMLLWQEYKGQCHKVLAIAAFVIFIEVGAVSWMCGCVRRTKQEKNVLWIMPVLPCRL